MSLLKEFLEHVLLQGDDGSGDFDTGRKGLHQARDRCSGGRNGVAHLVNL
jgi:hypothetical protein